MSSNLKYRSVYIGLFFAQILAVTCNAFLDIQYGMFGIEVVLWAFAFGFSLLIGLRQHGIANEGGKKMMRWVLILGGILFVIVFIPVWGFPRAGLYLLAVLQAAYNCITTSRRQLYMGLLMTLVMVMFAASHYRADWTMLFYLVPYITSVVFTVVAEQINGNADELQAQSLGKQVAGGQMIAIASATLTILIVGLFLYLITPQKTLVAMYWKWGNPTAFGLDDKKNHLVNGGNMPSQASGSQGQTTTIGSQKNMDGFFSGWLTPEEMRLASTREGMPKWQASTINMLADVSELARSSLQPVLQKAESFWQALKQWLKENTKQIIRTLILFSLLVLFVALMLLLRDAKADIWIRTRIDYLRLGVLNIYGSEYQVARVYYSAIERLFELHDVKRSPGMNAREYLLEVNGYWGEVEELKQITQIFEDLRYGDKLSNKRNSERMISLYRSIYKSLS